MTTGWQPPEHLVSYITVDEFRQQHGDLIARVFGDPLYEDFGLHNLLNVVLHPGWSGIILPLSLGDLDNTELFVDGPPEGDECGWDGAVNWMAVLLSVHWTRPAPYVYKARIGCFDPVWSERSGTDPVRKAVAMSDFVTSSLTNVKCGIYSDFVIDPLGEWGLIECNDCLFSLLVAKNALYDRFVTALGGLDFIQKGVQTEVARNASQEGIHNPERWGDGVSEIQLAMFRPLYDKVGWAWPFDDHVRPENYPELEDWLKTLKRPLT